MLSPRRHRQRTLLTTYCASLNGLMERENAATLLNEARRQAEAAAQFATEAMLRAQAANRAKSEFLANMSHELRTPLNAVLGFSELVKTEIEPGSRKGREYVEHIQTSGARLLALLNDILDVASAEAGRLQLQDGLVALDSFVPAQIRTFEAVAVSKKIRLEQEVPERLLVRMDLAKMKQAVGNLLSNAVKFTSAGGSILLRAARNNEGDLWLSVTDTGIGIPLEHLERVALPFEQMEGSYNRQHQGSGLGLPIARALIELHGGSLEIESELDVGTTVSLVLPADRVSPTAGSMWDSAERSEE